MHESRIVELHLKMALCQRCKKTVEKYNSNSINQRNEYKLAEMPYNKIGTEMDRNPENMEMKRKNNYFFLNFMITYKATKILIG